MIYQVIFKNCSPTVDPTRLGVVSCGNSTNMTLDIRRSFIDEPDYAAEIVRLCNPKSLTFKIRPTSDADEAGIIVATELCRIITGVLPIRKKKSDFFEFPPEMFKHIYSIHNILLYAKNAMDRIYDIERKVKNITFNKHRRHHVKARQITEIMPSLVKYISIAISG